LNRGDLVVCSLAGDYGKPRPAVVVQSNLFNPTHASVVVCPVTSLLIDASLFRINIPAENGSGLMKRSQVMVDKITAIRADRVQGCIGSLTAKQQLEIDQAMKTWLGL